MLFPIRPSLEIRLWPLLPVFAMVDLRPIESIGRGLFKLFPILFLSMFTLPATPIVARLPGIGLECPYCIVY
jgi:hypothetical protein